MEKTIKSYIRHESKVLFEIKARMFVPTSAFQTFNQQFLRFNVSDITRRGDIFEQFTRNADTVMDISPKRNSLMETVWEMERSCPNRRQDCATMTEYQRKILAKRVLRVQTPLSSRHWRITSTFWQPAGDRSTERIIQLIWKFNVE